MLYRVYCLIYNSCYCTKRLFSTHLPGGSLGPSYPVVSKTGSSQDRTGVRGSERQFPLGSFIILHRTLQLRCNDDSAHRTIRPLRIVRWWWIPRGCSTFLRSFGRTGTVYSPLSLYEAGCIGSGYLRHHRLHEPKVSWVASQTDRSQEFEPFLTSAPMSIGADFSFKKFSVILDGLWYTT